MGDVQPIWEAGFLDLPDWLNQFFSLLTGMQFFPLHTSETVAFDVQKALEELPKLVESSTGELNPAVDWLLQSWDAPATMNFQQ
ncbi:MAG TPA: hypothetical protein VHX59_26950, partial [Mycobacteriales bacterium]|nr:hypothetical protein [Mycobacteriales bacterium]